MARASARLRVALVCFTLGSISGALAFTDLKVTAADIFFGIFFVAGLALTIFAGADRPPWPSKRVRKGPTGRR